MERSAASPRRGYRVFAWAGALFFVIALIYFLYSYVLVFGRPSVAGSFIQPITWNVVLFTIFALHHSVFARASVRAWVTHRVPPELERSFYVWVASALFIAVCALWLAVPGIAWRARGAISLVLGVLQVTGVWLAVRSALYLDAFALAGVRQVQETGRAGETGVARGETQIEFKTSGPYGWVRHPIYSGWFLIVFAAPHMTMTRLTFAIVSAVYLLIAIPFEERSLRAAAPGLYDRYRHIVRWKLVPGIY